MKRRIIFYFYLLSILCSCDNSHEQVFLNELKVVIETQHEDTLIINIDNLTDFKWDSLFIIKPYMMGDEINKNLGLIWTNSISGVIFTEDQTLFIFKNSGKVIHDFFVSRFVSQDYKDFAFLDSIKYSKEEAKFISVKGEYVIRNLGYTPPQKNKNVIIVETP